MWFALSSSPVRADTGYGDSPDFSLDTFGPLDPVYAYQAPSLGSGDSPVFFLDTTDSTNLLQVTLTQIGSGTVTVTPAYTNPVTGYVLGESVTLTATPARWYEFVRWSDGVTTNPRPVTIGTNNQYTAIFTNTVPLEQCVTKAWEQNYGGLGADYTDDLRITPDGGCIVGGYSTSGADGNKGTTNYGGYDMWVLKLDAQGDRQWERNFGGTGDDTLYGLAVLNDGGYLLAGLSTSGISGNKTNASFGSADMWLIRLDAQGNRLWDRVYGGTEQDLADAVIQTSDGGFLVGGRSRSAPSGNKTSPNQGGDELWLLKLNSQGEKLWEYSSNAGGECSGVAEISDGYAIIGLVVEASIAVVKVDFEGHNPSQRFYSVPGISSLYETIPRRGGGLIVSAGSWVGPNPATTDGRLLLTDEAGNELANHNLGGDDYDTFLTLAALREGGFLVGGTSRSPVGRDKTAPLHGYNDGWLVKCNDQAEKLWDVSLGGTGDDQLLAIRQDAEGNFLAGLRSQSGISGMKTTPNYGDFDCWIVKLDNHEVPAGTPQVFINGTFTSSGTNTFTETNAVTVTMATSFTNGTIYYTLDGSSPSTNSPNSMAYTGAFSLANTNPVSRMFTLRAIAYNADRTQSWEADPVFIQFVARPALLVQQGTGTVTASPSQPSYALGDTVTLTATSGRWYEFVRWSDGVTTNPRPVTIGTNNQYTAVFTNTVPLELHIGKEWDRTYGGAGEDYLYSVAPTLDGGYLLGGASRSVASGNKTSGNHGDFDYWVVKVDGYGTKQWETNYGGAGDDRLLIAAQAHDGAYLLGGYSTSGPSGNKTSVNYGLHDFWLIKLNAAGSKLWETNYGGSGDESWWQSLSVTPDGGCIVGIGSSSGASGNKSSDSFGGYDYWVIKLDAYGAKQWETNYGGSGNDNLYKVLPTGDDGYILSGTASSPISGNKTSGSFGLLDGWIIKVDSRGHKMWETNYGGADDDNPGFVQQTSDGGYVLCGNSRSGVSGNKTSGNFGFTDAFVIRLDANGNQQWEQNLGGSANDGFSDLRLARDGGFIFGGSSSSPISGNKTSVHHGDYDFWLVKLDANGTKQWENSYGGPGYDMPNSLVPTPDGGFIIGGESGSGISGNKTTVNYGGPDFWIVKLSNLELPVGWPEISLDGYLANAQTNFIFTETNAVTVTMATSFTNGTIYYTLDGSDPGLASSGYSGPVTLANLKPATRTFTLRAIAYSADRTQSWEADPVIIRFIARPADLTQEGRGTLQAEPDQPSYALGDRVTLTATPARWYAFSHWRSNGVSVSGTTNLTILIGVTNTYTAVFTNTVSLELLVKTEWERVYGGSGDDYVNTMQLTPDGGCIIGGPSGSGVDGNKTATNYGGYDFWVLKLDCQGNKQWEHSYGGLDDEWLAHIVLLNDGGFLLVGYGFGVRLVRLDAEGNVVWHRTYEGVNVRGAFRAIETSDGGFLAVGNSSPPPYNIGHEAWAAKLNGNGDIEWEQTFALGYSYDDADQVVETANGYFVFGCSLVSGGNWAPWLLKVSVDGSNAVPVSYSAGALVSWSDPLPLSGGGYVVAGRTFGPGITPDWRILRTDADGSEVEAYAYDLGGSDELTMLIRLREGGFVGTGHGNAGLYGGYDGWVLRFNGEFQKILQLCIGGNNTDYLQTVGQTADYGLLVAGWSASVASGTKTTANFGAKDFWLVKLANVELPVGTPQIYVDGNFANSQTNLTITETNVAFVTLQTSFTNGTIYYTLDGSAPTTNSAVFAESFAITNAGSFPKLTTIRAVAYSSNWFQSAEADPVQVSIVPRLISIARLGRGSVTKSPDLITYPLGQAVTLTAAPDRWHAFSHWTTNATNALQVFATNAQLNVTIAASNNYYRAIFTNTVPLELHARKEWERVYGGTAQDDISDLQLTPDGGSIVAGQSASGINGNKTSDNWANPGSTNNGDYDFWVLKLDARGNKQWERSFGGTGNDHHPRVAVASDGGCVLSGYSPTGLTGNKTEEGFGAFDVWVIRLDADGNRLWDRRYGGTAEDEGRGVIHTSDGGFLIVGDSNSSPSGNKTSPHLFGYDIWVFKLDSTGDKLWERAFEYGSAYPSHETPNGYLVSGQVGNGGAWIGLVDHVGGNAVIRTYGGDHLMVASMSMPDGGFIMGGWYWPPATDWRLLRVDANLEVVGDRHYAVTGGTLVCLTPLAEGGFLVGANGIDDMGGLKPVDHGGSDTLLVKCNDQLENEWSLSLGGSGDDGAAVVRQTPDGGFLLASSSVSGISGTKATACFGGFDYWIVKLSNLELPVGTPQVYVDGNFANSQTNVPITETNVVQITLQTSFTNGTIYYTLDGSAPSTNSPNSMAYTGAFVLVNTNPVSRTFTLRAIGYNEERTQSWEADPVFVQFIARPVLLAQQGSGRVTASPSQPSYALGDTVTLTATPGRWYEFVRWSDGVTAGTRVITIGTNNQYTAVFTNTVPLELWGFAEEWESTYGGAGTDELRHMAPTSDGGFVLGGSSSSPPSSNKTSGHYGSNDFWLVKLNAGYLKDWDASFGGANDDVFGRVISASDGGFVLGGHSLSGASGNKSSGNYGLEDAWLVKLDGQGAKLWETNFGGASAEYFSHIAQREDGGFLIGLTSWSAPSGNKTSFNYGYGDYVLARLDASGAKQWETSFGGVHDDGLASVLRTSDGGYLLGGLSGSQAGGSKTAGHFGADNSYDYWVVKLNTNFVRQWEGNFGGLDFDLPAKVQPTADGGYLLGGSSRSAPGGNKTAPNYGGYDFWLVKMDAGGGKLWDVSYGGTGEDRLNWLQPLPDGTFLAAGYSASGADGNKTSAGFGGGDGWILWLDANGSKLWETNFGGSGADALNCILPTLDGGFLLGGHSASTNSATKTSPNFGASDYWLIKLGIREAPVGTPQIYVNGALGNSNTFVFPDTNVVEIRMQTSFTNGTIFYTTNGLDPVGGMVHETPFNVRVTAPFMLRAGAFNTDYTLWQEADPVWFIPTPRFQLHLATSGQGAVFVEVGGQRTEDRTFLSNTVVTLTAVPMGNNLFIDWSGDVSSTNNPLDVTMDRAQSITANFLPLYSLKVISNAQGSVRITEVSGQMSDVSPSSNMVLIPAGEFAMGDTFAEAYAEERPVHTVYASVFCMDRYEVTKALWDEVYSWAMAHGYTFDNAGAGKAANHPVQTVNWYDAVKWCNARSEMERRVPAYYTDASQTTVYRVGQVNVQNDWVNWSAGYCLPTEAQWEKAARGGVPGTRFPWSHTNVITHALANYRAFIDHSYDLSYPAGYHPTFATNGEPYTSPVDALAPNGYGLHDMAGNVLEWCWDWFGNYENTPQIDTRGPEAGSLRMMRSGFWSGNSENSRIANRSRVSPSYTDNSIGFRTVLPPVQGYLTNTTVTLSATGTNGWTFMNWNGNTSLTNNPITITMDQDREMQAIFGTPITLSPIGSGTVQKQPNLPLYAYGSAVRLSAVPNAGAYFRFWGGAAAGQVANPLEFMVTNVNPTISALFATLGANEYALTLLVNGEGTVSKNPQLEKYPNGAQVTITATPKPGHVFAGWSGAVEGADPLSNPLALVMTSNRVINATFQLDVPPVTFEDASLESAVRTALDLSSGPIHRTNLLALTGLYAANLSITSLSGLEWAVNLDYFEADQNQISDLGPLAGLTNLAELTLAFNRITNVAALSGLTQLTRLDVGGNLIPDLAPVAGLTNLNRLDLYQCGVTDLSWFAGFPKLTVLGLNDNLIDDLTRLAGLTNLTELYLSGNPCGNLAALAGLTNLTLLEVNNTGLTDLSGIAPLWRLVWLGIQYNDLRDPGLLAGLTNLTELYAGDNRFADLAVVTNLSRLTVLEARGSLIRDLGPVAGLTNLTMLSLNQNRLADISPLRELTQLAELSLGYNTITNLVPLAGLTNLTGLYLSENWLTDIAVLSGLSNLAAIELQGNLLNVEAGSPAEVTIQTLSNRGTAITYLPQAEGPKISPIDDLVMMADGPLGPITFRVASRLLPVEELNLTGYSSDPTLMRDEDIAFGGHGEIRNVTFAAQANQSGTTTISIMVDDGTNSDSVHFLLTVVSRPVITLQPQNQTALVGTDVTFSLTATGPRPLTYQWYHDGSLEQGARSAELSLTNLQSANAGEYYCVITNIYGATTSAVATLTVTNPPGNLPPLVGIVTPTNGAVFTLTTPQTNIVINVNASDTDGSIAQVQVFAGTNRLGTLTNAPYTLVWSNVGVGVYSLTALAFDNLGSNSVSTPVVVSVLLPSGPAAFRFSQALYPVGEAASSAMVRVTKTTGGGGAINYATREGTAKAVNNEGYGDYQTVSGSLVFEPLDTEKTITIPIVNDLGAEGDQEFYLELSLTGDGSTLGNPSIATIRILDDEPPAGLGSALEVRTPAEWPAPLGRVRVQLEPAGNGGGWRFAWETEWRASGTEATGLEPGDYAVYFRPVSGSMAPAPDTFTLAPGVAMVRTNYYIVSGQPVTGSLLVQLQPLGGRWRFQGQPIWMNSGGLATGIAEGERVIECEPISGRVTPAPARVVVLGHTNVTVSVYYPPATDWGVSTPAEPTVVPFASLQAQQNPYACLGQLWTAAGYSSGYVVKERVVLTAGHALFNEADMAFADEALWFFQRHKSEHEPLPQRARGWYVFGGYAAARSNSPPGQSSVEAYNLDVAAVYFLEAAGRHGYGGYAVSDVAKNWLLGPEDKLLAGYPVTGKDGLLGGKLYATLSAKYSFELVQGNVYGSAGFRSYPGNSGGPLCAQNTNGYFYPAAVYLGESGPKSIVRLIDTNVVDLINRADLSANTGDNNTGGGVILLTPGIGGGLFEPAYLQMLLTPPEAIAAGAGWRLVGHPLPDYYSNNNAVYGLLAGGYTVEYRTIPGYQAPSNRFVQLVAGQTAVIDGHYVLIAPGFTPPGWSSNGMMTFGLTGAPGQIYVLEVNTNLGQTNWRPLQTNTLGTNGLWLFSDPASTNLPARYYRARER